MGVTLDWLDCSLGPLIEGLSYHGCCFVSSVLRDILFVVVLCRMLYSWDVWDLNNTHVRLRLP